MREEGRCFVCLGRIRVSKKCNGKHHQSIGMKSTDSNGRNQEGPEFKELRQPNGKVKDAESAKATTTNDHKYFFILFY